MPRPEIVHPRLPLEDLFHDYLDDCRARGLRTRTVEQAYSWAIRTLFLPWCAERGVTGPDELTPALINRWTAELHARGGPKGKLAPASILAYVEQVNRWLRWVHAQGEMPNRLQAHRPRLARRVLPVLSPEEVTRMADAAKSQRDRLIVQLLWEGGLRASELLHLRLDDVVEQRRQGYLRVLAPEFGGGAKGGHERLVPIPKAYRPLQRYIQSQRPEADSDRIFLSLRRDRHGQFVPLELNGLEQVVRNLAADARIGRRVWVHLFRHSAATRMLKAGMNPLLVAKVLGHTSLAMIERVYSHLDMTDAYEALARVLAD